MGDNIFAKAREIYLHVQMHKTYNNLHLDMHHTRRLIINVEKHRKWLIYEGGSI